MCSGTVEGQNRATGVPKAFPLPEHGAAPSGIASLGGLIAALHWGRLRSMKLQALVYRLPAWSPDAEAGLPGDRPSSRMEG